MLYSLFFLLISIIFLFLVALERFGKISVFYCIISMIVLFFYSMYLLYHIILYLINHVEVIIK